MKSLRLYLITIFVLFTVVHATAENYINKAFSEYGIGNIGVYIESYPDYRSDNFVFEVASIRSNGILMDYNFFRYRYCNFDLTTPPLTTPGYPLEGNTEGETNSPLSEGIINYLGALGWDSSMIHDFDGGNLGDLLEQARNEELDSVLVVRYIPILYFLPIENYDKSGAGNKATADIGKIKKGMGLIPAIELYDTESGNRLWYSAYHTGHQNIARKKSFEEYVVEADRFFAHTDKNTVNVAVEKMIGLTLGNSDTPFPEASISGDREDGIVRSRVEHLFWTDYPSYAFYGNLWGIGYAFDYIGTLGISYKDSFLDSSPVERAGAIENAVMHGVSLPFLSLTVRNFAIEPALSFSVILPTSANISYTDIKNDFHGGYYVVPDTTDVATLSVTSLGFELSVKYLLRFTDRFSLFVSGNGSIQTWWQTVSGYETAANNFTVSYNGLYTNYNYNFLVNASVIAGFRWDSETPFELFAEYTPIGPGDNFMVSAGLRFIPFTWGIIDPHARNIAGNLRGY